MNDSPERKPMTPCPLPQRLAIELRELLMFAAASSLVHKSYTDARFTLDRLGIEP